MGTRLAQTDGQTDINRQAGISGREADKRANTERQVGIHAAMYCMYNVSSITKLLIQIRILS
jgi:hypothetical protein